MSSGGVAAGVELVPPHRGWAVEFMALAALAREALGPAALRIDHIGSTAVPGLAAKDVIDLQVAVTALDPAVAPLQAAGFVLRGSRRDAPPPGAGWSQADAEKLLLREPEGCRRANVHVRVWGRANQRLSLLMRDHLRANVDAATAYVEFKRRLAAAGVDSETYAAIKDPVFHLMHQAAERWAVSTGWTPGGSDA